MERIIITTGIRAVDAMPGEGFLLICDGRVNRDEVCRVLQERQVINGIATFGGIKAHIVHAGFGKGLLVIMECGAPAEGFCFIVMIGGFDMQIQAIDRVITIDGRCQGVIADGIFGRSKIVYLRAVREIRSATDGIPLLYEIFRAHMQFQTINGIAAVYIEATIPIDATRV